MSGFILMAYGFSWAMLLQVTSSVLDFDFLVGHPPRQHHNHLPPVPPVRA